MTIVRKLIAWTLFSNWLQINWWLISWLAAAPNMKAERLCLGQWTERCCVTSCHLCLPSVIAVIWHKKSTSQFLRDSCGLSELWHVYSWRDHMSQTWAQGHTLISPQSCLRSGFLLAFLRFCPGWAWRCGSHHWANTCDDLLKPQIRRHQARSRSHA